MCTLAWGSEKEGVWICFNRDEQRTRAEAEPPGIHVHGGQRLLYPRDPEGGGTWFALHPAGFAVALLNHYPAVRPPTPVHPRSRGLLVPELAACGSVPVAANWLRQQSLDAYRPCTLVLLSRNEAALYSWGGRKLEWASHCPFFHTSSSYKPDQVARWRQARWEAATGGTVAGPREASLLLQQVAPDPAYGFTMDRDDARTVSRIEARMDPGGVELVYFPREIGGSGFAGPERIRFGEESS